MHTDRKLAGAIFRIAAGERLKGKMDSEAGRLCEHIAQSLASGKNKPNVKRSQNWLVIDATQKCHFPLISYLCGETGLECTVWDGELRILFR